LNGNSNRGGAYGFKLDSLEKLTDLKMNQAKKTALQYIVELIETEIKEVLIFKTGYFKYRFGKVFQSNQSFQ
jgi:diaphanous 1